MSGSKAPERWVVPGGGIEPTEDSVVAALREVEEEAGVKGVLRRCLGVFEVSQLFFCSGTLFMTSSFLSEIQEILHSLLIRLMYGMCYLICKCHLYPTLVIVSRYVASSYERLHIDGLVEGRRNSSANALELRLSCTNPLTCYEEVPL